MTYTVPPRLAWQVDEEQDELVVYLMRLPNGEPVALEGVAALIWVAAVEGEEAVSIVAQATGESREDIEPAVVDYLGELVEIGHLRRVQDGGQG